MSISGTTRKVSGYIALVLAGILLGGTASAGTSDGKAPGVAPIRLDVPLLLRAERERCFPSGECGISDTKSIPVTIPASMGRADISVTYSFSYVSSPNGGARLDLVSLCDGGGGTAYPGKFLLAPSTSKTATSVTWVVNNIRANDQTCGLGAELRLLNHQQPGRVAALGGVLLIEISSHQS